MRLPLRRFANAFVILTLFGFSAVAAYAQSVADGVVINADYMFRDAEKTRLKGNVQLVFKGQHLSCDKATLDSTKGQVTAEGHVILSNESAHVEADRLVFNYRDNTGFIYNGFVQSGQVVFDGEVVEKVGENHYVASNATYTACETCPPGWSFSGRKIDAEIGGYARIQRPVFRVGGVPILILPGIIVPLKSSRQSGVLVPTMDYSNKDGLGLSGSYFWAINRSQDLTITGLYSNPRGYKGLGDYRYVLTKDSKGELKAGFLEDRQFKNEHYTAQNGQNVDITDNLDRWYILYDHYYELPDNFVHRANIHQVSDLRYTRDFPEEVPGHGDSALENKTSITKTTDNQYASAEVDVYSNLFKYYPVQPNDDAVNRFPEIRYSIKEQRLFESGPMVRMDLDYTNFAREKYAYDNLKACPTCPTPWIPELGPRGEIGRTGSFDSDDLWRTGQRLDVQPAISLPFQLARKFDVMPSLLYRETQYRFNSEDPVTFPNTAARRYVQTDFKVKTEFSRVFGDLGDPKGKRWKHSFEPEIGYSHIPFMRTPNHPFFGNFRGLKYTHQYDPISDADINNANSGVQFDYNDRTFERRLVNYAIDNRITRKFWKDGDPEYRTVALFRVGQFYDFNEADRNADPGRPDTVHPWSSIDSSLVVRLDHFETYTISSYNTYAHRNNFFSRVRGMLTPQNFLEVSYTNTFIMDNDDEEVQGSETRNYGVGGGLVTKYFDAVGQINISDITGSIQSWSYGLNIRPPGRCWVIHVEHTQNVGGTPRIRASLSFDFGGETKKDATTRSQTL